MYHNTFIHSFVDGHLGCSHVLAIINTAAVNVGIHMSFSIMVFSGYMPNSGIVGSYSSFTPHFLRNLHIFLHSGCINLHSHQQCKRVKTILQSYSHQDSMVPAQKQKYRPMEQNRKPRNKPMHVWVPYF